MYIDGITKGAILSPAPSTPFDDGQVSQISSQSDGIASYTVQKGLLWQQRDRLFSRWKERYFVLTPDYLNCFRKATDSGADRISNMGSFLFKVKLVDVDRVEWVNRRNCNIVAIHLARDGRILLRANHGLDEWFENLDDCRIKSRKRREMLRMSHDCYPLRDLENEGLTSLNSANGSTHGDWIIARSRIAAMNRNQLADSVADVSSVAASSVATTGSREDNDKWPSPSQQRNSLLGNVDLNAIEASSSWVPPSLRGRTPSRANSDIFFMAAACRQRASIASPVSTSMVRGLDAAEASFKLPNMLHSTRGIANRYSYAEEKISEIGFSAFDGRHRPAFGNLPS